MAAIALDGLERLVVLAGLEVRVQWGPANFRSRTFIQHLFAERPIGEERPCLTAAARLVALLPVALLVATAVAIEAEKIELLPPARLALAWITRVARLAAGHIAGGRATVVMRH